MYYVKFNSLPSGSYSLVPILLTINNAAGGPGWLPGRGYVYGARNGLFNHCVIPYLAWKYP